MSTTPLANSTATAPSFDQLVALSSLNKTPAGTVAQNSETKSTTQTSQVDPGVLAAVTDANKTITSSVSKLEARLDKYDEERKGYMATLNVPPPQSMKMTADQMTDVENKISQHMGYWNDKSMDVHGHNDRETNAINKVDGALRDNAKYLTYDQAISMLATADANGLQSNGGNFEDGSWQKTYDSIRGLADGAKQIFSQDMAAWKNPQSAAKAGLGNVTSLLGSVQQSVDGELASLKSDLAQLQGMVNKTVEQSKNNVNLTNFSNGTDESDPFALSRRQSVKVGVKVNDGASLPALTALNVNVNVLVA